jgi:hypothetical protein
MGMVSWAWVSASAWPCRMTSATKAAVRASGERYVSSLTASLF